MRFYLRRSERAWVGSSNKTIVLRRERFVAFANY
jgi:hypothetical protein